MNDTGNQMDLIHLLMNLGKFMPSLITLTQVIMAIVGVFMVVQGLLALYWAGNDNATQSFGTQSRPSYSGGLASVLIGTFLSGFATLRLVGAFSSELLGNVQQKITSEALDLSASSSDKFGSAEAQAAVIALLLIMQCVGIVAIFKSLLICNNKARGTASGEESFGRAAFFFFFGLLAWNFQLTSQIINNTVGFDVIAIFTPFAN
jgi:hypothetical protein